MEIKLDDRMMINVKVSSLYLYIHTVKYYNNGELITG